MKSSRFSLTRIAATLLVTCGLASHARAFTCDVAYPFRMPTGFPGDVSRAHPFSVYPVLANTSVQAPRLIGDPVLVNAADNTLRGLVAGDGSVTPLAIYGIVARPYPFQQTTGGPNAAIGTAAVPAGIIDVCRLGVVIVKLPAGTVVAKGGTVYAWAAATAGANIQGGFVGAASSTNTITITNAKFLGPADAQGFAEVEVWMG